MFVRLIKFLIISSLAVLPLTTYGQMNINIPYALSNELGVEIIPKYPRPNETVFINLSLYTDDLNSATITWYKDGKNVLSGKGETRYYFKTGNIGESVDIEIVIKLLNGTSFSKKFTLNPASVDVVWEANSYVPPFYKGKALHPRQGILKIVAMPEFVKNGRRISLENLVYEWSNDSEVYEKQSGYGRNVLILSGSLLGRNEELELLVTDPANNLVAQKFISIPTVDPEIIFYENNPYYGHIFESSIQNPFNLKSEEVQMLVAPYYFTSENAFGLKYEWRLNGREAQNISDSRTVIFKKPEGESGQSNISLSVENINRILQRADNSIMIKFED